MNLEIADILAEKLSGLSFKDKLVGLVRTVQVTTPTADGLADINKYPVSCRRTYNECEYEGFSELIPDSSKKSILYFEDGGVNFDGMGGTSSLRLVCWANLQRLAKAELASTSMIAEILRGLPRVPFAAGNFTHIFISVDRQAIRENGIFSNYTYNEERTQYLFYPYDFFALDLTVTFKLKPECYVDSNGYNDCI